MANSATACGDRSAVTLILTTIDRIKDILGQLEATEAEPEGNDQDLIGELEAMVERGWRRWKARLDCCGGSGACRSGCAGRSDRGARRNRGVLLVQTLERPLRPGEVSLDDLERRSARPRSRSSRPMRKSPHPRRLCRGCARSRWGESADQPAVKTKEAKAAAKASAAAGRPGMSTRRRPIASPTSRSASMSTRSNI